MKKIEISGESQSFSVPVRIEPGIMNHDYHPNDRYVPEILDGINLQWHIAHMLSMHANGDLGGKLKGFLRKEAEAMSTAHDYQLKRHYDPVVVELLGAVLRFNTQVAKYLGAESEMYKICKGEI